MSTVALTINGQQIEAEQGMTILQAAQQAGIAIPTLCYHPDLRSEGVCRICVVEVEGQKILQPSCAYPITEGMVVNTHSPRVRAARKTIIELLLANHPDDCLVCNRNQKCELQKFAQDLGVQKVRYRGERQTHPVDDTGKSVVRNPEKCILCKRCLRVCEEIQSVGTLTASGRGWDTTISPALGKKLADAVCVNCGQCINRCPTGALREKSSIDAVWAALSDPTKHVVVQTAPAVRAAIGEEFGMPAGSLVTGKMVTALRMMGYDKVFDTDFTADLTIMEEGSELLKRINEGGTLPLITSCSPGWIKFIEHFYPEMLPNLSTCKSPQQMFGALAKTYYPEKAGIDPKDVVVVSIMPCTAKKFECDRPEMNSSGYQDVDYVLTTREAAQMMREAGINLATLPDQEFDAPLGMSTGAAVIFGNTGGVMEAALRTVYKILTGTEIEGFEIAAVRGLEGVREAEIEVAGIKVRAAVANGLANARALLERVKAGEQYHFIEIMACPGGCIGGGGQPQPTSPEIRQKRIDAIYQADRGLQIRRSHENPAVITLYAEFLGEPLSHKSHELLHTHYTPRGTETKKVEEPIKVPIE